MSLKSSASEIQAARPRMGMARARGRMGAYFALRMLD